MTHFSFHGIIADIDETVAGEPFHPTTVPVVAAHDAITRVVVPERVLGGRLALLCVDRPVHVEGDMKNSPHGPHHIVTGLRLSGAGH